MFNSNSLHSPLYVLSRCSNIESIFSSKYTIGGALKNLNTKYRPLSSIPKLDLSTEYFINEAAEAPNYGEPGKISDMISPKYCVFTNVGLNHAKTMKSKQRVYESMCSAERGMPKDGVFILNADDEFQLPNKLSHKIVTYGKSAKADF